jgi:hypothetical protein
MAENSTVIDLLTVGGGFTAEQVDALRRCFEVYEDRVVANETLAESFGDLSSADNNDTLVADSNGVFQVNAV